MLYVKYISIKKKKEKEKKSQGKREGCQKEAILTHFGEL